MTGSIIRGKNDFWVVKLSPESVGTEQPHTGNLVFYPNPAQGFVRIETADSDTRFNIMLTDILGRKVLQQLIASDDAFDVSSLPTGLYLVSATADSGRRYVGKLEKK